MKNIEEETINSSYISGNITDEFVSCSLTPTLVSVQAGDLLCLSVMGQNAETFNVMECKLTVEVIE